MGRFITSSIFFLFFGIVGVATAPAAFAGDHISGVIAGEKVLPDAVKHLRYINSWKQRARYNYEVASHNRDRKTMREIEYDWSLAEQEERDTRLDLRDARTRVTVYGDAMHYMTEQRKINLLVNTGAWEYAHVHVFQRDGQLLWDTRAPRGYDNRRSKPKPSGSSNNKPKPNFNGGPYGIKPTPTPIVPFQTVGRPLLNGPRGQVPTGGLYGLP